ncbi:MAG: hypothetical protein MJZ26_00895 [Fibrobacter sp.]|nr:hypothetical protein [Fibrobacter sp.]
MSLEDCANVAQICGVVIAFVGALITWNVWRNDKREKNIAAVYEMFKNIRLVDKVKEFMYVLDYGEHWYDENFHKRNKKLDEGRVCIVEEHTVDSYLSVLNFSAYMLHAKAFDEEQLELFDYEFRRTLVNSELQNYLYNIWHFSTQHQMICPFADLVNYAREKGLLRTDFFDPNACKNEKFPKYLNW